MKLVKPMAVSFSFRTFQMLGRQELCVTCLIGFSLGTTARRLVSDIVLWPAIGEATPGIVDEGLPKARAEVLVYGSCHPPGGLPVAQTMVRVALAASGAPQDAPPIVDKKLAVFGDRYWGGTAAKTAGETLASSSEASEPVPFTKMPIGWERAFGGASYAKNPLGRGIDRVDAGDGTQRVPLPNVELAESLVASSSDRPEPGGFGPLDLSWPQRQSKVGTYGGTWLEEDFPGYARDTDPSFFSTASPDQRIDGFLRGDEEYFLQNLHPTRSVLRGRLPGAAARVLVRRKGSQDVEDVAMTLDTIVFLPGKEIGILVFRGLTPVLEDDASDIAVALAACEDLGAPRTAAHYTAALDRRLDKNLSPLLALNENELLPSFAAGTGMAELLGTLTDPTKAIRERTRRRVRQQLVDDGVTDPDEVIAKALASSPLLERLERLPNAADPQDLADYAAALDALDEAADKQHAEAQAALKKQIEEKLAEARRDGASFPDGLLDGQSVGSGPPAPQTPEVLAMMREAEIEPDPAYIAKLRQADAAILTSYRESAHYMAPAAALDAKARAAARGKVLELRATGASFADLALTRFDLSALDLRKGDLRKTLLEGADLTGTNLAGADLSGVVLAHAKLHGSSFDRAKLEGANLGSSAIDGASFAGANLLNAVFARAKLVSASFRGADLAGTDWLEAELGAVDFEGVTAPKLVFFPLKVEMPKKGVPTKEPTPTDLTGCRFPRASLKKGSFLYAKLGGVDFTEADLELVTFVTVTADGANFRGASLRKLHAVMGCTFAGANFDGADLTDAFLRGSDLRGASFVGARLTGADLSECDLTGATLSLTQAKGLLLIRAELRGANLHGANLMDAMLQKSRLHGANLSSANLFAANLGLIRLDDATNVKGANLKRALMLPKARKTT